MKTVLVNGQELEVPHGLHGVGLELADIIQGSDSPVRETADKILAHLAHRRLLVLPE